MSFSLQNSCKFSSPFMEVLWTGPDEWPTAAVKSTAMMIKKLHWKPAIYNFFLMLSDLPG